MLPFLFPSTRRLGRIYVLLTIVDLDVTTFQVTHAGRGGAGNVRSPSREPGAIREEISRERGLIDASKDPNERVVFVRATLSFHRASWLTCDTSALLTSLDSLHAHCSLSRNLPPFSYHYYSVLRHGTVMR